MQRCIDRSVLHKGVEIHPHFLPENAKKDFKIKKIMSEIWDMNSTCKYTKSIMKMSSSSINLYSSASLCGDISASYVAPYSLFL